MHSETSALGAKTLIKKFFKKLGSGVIIGIGMTLGIGIMGIVYAVWSDLPNQTANSPLTATIWNDVVNKINDIGRRTDGITNTGITRDAFNTSTAWVTIPTANGWTSTAYCRRIGSFIQFKGYFSLTSGTNTSGWGITLPNIPSSCWPSTSLSLNLISGSCWSTSNVTSACPVYITTGGLVYTYNMNSFYAISFVGTYPAD